MNFEQAKEIMATVYDFYPNINHNKSPTFNKTWLKAIMQGDYEKTKAALEDYCFENEYPPKIANFVIKPYKHRDDKMPEKIREAEETVRKEMADPEIAARRKAKLDKMRQKLERMQAESRVRHDD